MFDAEGVRIDPSPPPRARREAADDLAHSGDITPTSYPSPGSVPGNIYRPTYNGHPTTNAVGLQGRQAFSALPESTVASGTRPNQSVPVLTSDDASQESPSDVFSARATEGYWQPGYAAEYSSTGQAPTHQGDSGVGHD